MWALQTTVRTTRDTSLLGLQHPFQTEIRQASSEAVLFPSYHKEIWLDSAGPGKKGNQNATEIHQVRKSTPNQIIAIFDKWLVRQSIYAMLQRGLSSINISKGFSFVTNDINKLFWISMLQTVKERPHLAKKLSGC